MNSNLGLILAWLVWAIDRSFRTSLRIKVKEENKRYMVLSMVCIGMDSGGRLGGECQRMAFRAPHQFAKLNSLNGE
jgi:hypothetical protein